MKTIIYFSFAICILLITNCDNSGDSPNQSNNNSKASDYFPNTLGSYWKYSYYNFNMSYDTLTISILGGDFSYNNKKYFKVIVEDRLGFVYLSYYRLDNSALYSLEKIYNDDNPNDYIEKKLFDLDKSVGTSWFYNYKNNNSDYYDTFTIISKDTSITIQNQTFINCVLVNHTVEFSGSSEVYFDFYAKNIGKVHSKMEKKGIIFESYEIFNYSIK
jgi:hypothetical protein